MRRVIVNYRVKADRVAENEGFIREVFAQLARERPDGLRYASFKGDDGVSFTHVASIETDDGVNPLLALSAFKAFTANIEERCEGKPVTTVLHEVGRYRLFESG